MFQRRPLLTASLLAGLMPMLGAPTLARAQTARAWRTQVPEIRYGMISVENERDAIARLQGMAAYLRQALDTPVRAFRGSDYAGVVEALRSGHAEFAYLGPASYALAYRLMGEKIAPFARAIDNQGMEGYFSTVIVKADSPIRAMADLRGKTMAWVDANSTSGFQFPSYFLRKDGMDPAGFFSRTGFAGSHENVVIAVLNGQYDCGAVSFSNEARNTFQRMEEKGMIPPGSIRAVWRTPLIPNSPFVGRTDLPGGLGEAFVAAMMAMPQANPQAFAEMTSNARGLAPARHADYLDVIAVTEENSALRRQQRRS